VARPQQVSDHEILEVARRVFLEAGPGVSTARIAAELGVSQAALFKRYHTKENLMIAALAPPAAPPWLGMVEAGPDARPLDAQLVEVGVAAVRFFRAVVPCLMVMKAAGMDPESVMARFDDPPPLRARRVLAGWFARACADGRMRCGDPVHLAQHFLGALHIRAFLGHVFPDASPASDDATYVAHLVETLWTGIAPEEVAR
jgi:AcrR family transcriptional regulator